MTVCFSTFFRDALFATPTLLDSASVGIRLFRSAPSFSANDARYSGITTASGLLSLPGWAEVSASGYPLASTQSVTRRVNPPASANNYILLPLFPFTGLASSVEVRAVAYYYVGNISGTINPLIMVTDTPFNGQRMVVGGVDALTSNPDASMAGSNRWLFSWATPSGGTSSALVQSEGPLAVLRGAPAFETSHAQHVWLYPQRANLIANPSFEKDAAFWLSNGTIARVAEAAVGVGVWAGRFTGAAPVVAESNIFDTQFEERWTIQLMAKGTGNLKVGFVWWDGTFQETAVDWGEETWKLDPTNYVRVAVVRTAYQTFQGMVRLECDSGSMTIDNVLVEKGYLKDWQYFDGDTTYGARDDFSWYGGPVNQGASYSFWYNNKRATFGRLFARDIDGTTLVTDEVMTQQGFVYQWVPAGTTVQPHIDVLYPNDLQLPLASRSGAVLHYRADDSDLLGIVSPWPPLPPGPVALAATAIGGATVTGTLGSSSSCTAVLNEPFDNLAAWAGSVGTIVAGRNGTALQIISSGGVSRTYTIPTAAKSNYVTMGFALNMPNVAANINYMLSLQSDAGTVDQITLQINTSGAITIYKGGVASIILGASANGVIVANTWQYIEMQVFLDDVAGTVVVKVGGTTVLNITPTDTRASGSNPIDAVALRGAWFNSNTSLWDDLYLTTGAACAFQGDHVITNTGPTLLNDPCENLTAWTLAGAPTVVAGGHAGNCFQLNAGSSQQIKYLVPGGGQTNTLTVGAWFNLTPGGIGWQLITFRGDAGATLHVNVNVAADGTLTVVSGGVGLCNSAAGAMPVTTWTFVEVSVKLGDGTSGSVTLRVNGSTVASNLACDTKNAGTATVFDQMWIQSVGSISAWKVDDIYVRNDATFGP